MGKSVISAAIAEMLARSGLKVGLMDADIYGPSSALLFGLRGPPREEESGLSPPVGAGVKLMSVDLFASGRPIPLTGAGATRVLAEMLSLTDWGALDYLLVDLPPATGDIMLFLTSLDKRKVKALVVTMPDKLSRAVARRVLALLQSENVPVVGVLGNMTGKGNHAAIGKLARDFGVPLLGLLPLDSGVPRAVEKSDVRSLLVTRFGRELRGPTRFLAAEAGRHKS